jgi:hypothetical protein
VPAGKVRTCACPMLSVPGGRGVLDAEPRGSGVASLCLISLPRVGLRPSGREAAGKFTLYVSTARRGAS